VGIAAAALILALVCVGLAVDTGADASFDAPKRLASLLFVGIAAAALAFSPWKNPLAGGHPASAARLALLLTAAALVWALFSALVSPRSAAALDATRALGLYALLLPIGASRLLERRGRVLLGVFLAVAAVDATVSILQARGLYQPFPLATATGSRESTGAFVGNVGYLAVALALAAVAALGVLLCANRPALRAAAGAAGLLFLVGLLVNRNLTSLSALLAGGAIAGFALFGRRAWLPAVAGVLLFALGVAAYRPMRERVAEAVAAAKAGDWDKLVSYRVGAWKAALAMTKERPLFGYGPGTFEAEYVPHRLAVEIASRRRYTNPLRTSSYAEAHCDYLQPFAEAGVPAGLAALGAVFFLFAGLVRAIRRGSGQTRAEAVFLLAFLGAGAAAALTWFPMQRPISALPLLLAAGRAWTISRRAAFAVVPS
jgi:O-antigen ligase